MARRARRADAGTAEQRRQQILRATLKIIAERGHADTRITDVADRAGTSPALVIYYFKTRDRLLTEAIRYAEDTWYATAITRMAPITTAAGKLTELIAMTCLPETGPAERGEWLLRLDLWALAPRNPGVAAIRRESDDRWRDIIREIVLAGQKAREFTPVNADDFAVTLSALLDGMAVRIALDDPNARPARAYDLAMRYTGEHLGFEPGRRSARQPAAPLHGKFLWS